MEILQENGICWRGMTIARYPTQVDILYLLANNNTPWRWYLVACWKAEPLETKVLCHCCWSIGSRNRVPMAVKEGWS